MKRLIGVLAVSALIGGACGGSDPVEQPAAFEDVEVNECVTQPVAVPGISVLGHRVQGIENLKVCVDVSAQISVVPEVVQYEDCGNPCYAVVLNGFNVAADEKIEVTLTRDGEPQPPIVYDPPAIQQGSQTGRVCVAGIGGPPDPCSERVTKPRNLTATPRRGKIALTWRSSVDVGEQNLAGYEIWRSQDGAEGTFSVLATVTETAFVDTSVTKGQEYWYYVVAYDEDGNRKGSDTVSASPR